MSFRIDPTNGLVPSDVARANSIVQQYAGMSGEFQSQSNQRFTSGANWENILDRVSSSFNAQERVSISIQSAPIVVRHQLNFGEVLFLRGEGFDVAQNDLSQQRPGFITQSRQFLPIDWNRGVKLENIGPDAWTTTICISSNKVAFKVLINDTQWEDGENHNFRDLCLLMKL